MSGNAASKKQPTFEQFSPANIFTLHWRNDPAGGSSRRDDPSTPDWSRRAVNEGGNFFRMSGLAQRPAQNPQHRLLVAGNPMSLPPTISDVVLPFVTPAIRGCSCGIDTVLAQHVAPVSYPCVEGAEPLCPRLDGRPLTLPRRNIGIAGGGRKCPLAIIAMSALHRRLGSRCPDAERCKHRRNHRRWHPRYADPV